MLQTPIFAVQLYFPYGIDPDPAFDLLYRMTSESIDRSKCPYDLFFCEFDDKGVLIAFSFDIRNLDEVYHVVRAIIVLSHNTRGVELMFQVGGELFVRSDEQLNRAVREES